MELLHGIQCHEVLVECYTRSQLLLVRNPIYDNRVKYVLSAST
jgi:hypothetical protein